MRKQGTEPPIRSQLMEGEMTKVPSTLHFVLVHGSCHGAWCWYKLRRLLEAAGHRVTCLDLASSGIDTSDADRISNFVEYNKPLLDLMANLSDDRKVILVGHSAGGISLTQIIHKFPKKIHVAVFLAATMLKFGFQTDQDRKDGAPDESKLPGVFAYEYGTGVDQPPTTSRFNKEFLRPILYNTTPLEMLLRPCPVRALINAKFTPREGDESWDRVPRVYIKTQHDHMVLPEKQETMIKLWLPSQVYEIDNDHSPFLSNPSALFGILTKAAVARAWL